MPSSALAESPKTAKERNNVPIQIESTRTSAISEQCKAAALQVEWKLITLNFAARRSAVFTPLHLK